jgi:hypothetical protein
MNITKGFCHDCDKNVKLQKKGLNHILHIILTIFTLGVWGLIYVVLLIAALGGFGWKCSECGSDEVDTKI